MDGVDLKLTELKLNGKALKKFKKQTHKPMSPEGDPVTEREAQAHEKAAAAAHAKAVEDAKMLLASVGK